MLLSPDNNIMPDEPEESHGGKADKLPDKPVKKGILGFMKDILNGDPTVQKLDSEQAADDAEYTRKKSERAAEKARLESEAITRARESSPEWKAQQREAKKLQKAYYDEARRMAAILWLADDLIRRHPNRIDQQLISWCDGILHNYHLHGLLSRPEKE